MRYHIVSDEISHRISSLPFARVSLRQKLAFRAELGLFAASHFRSSPEIFGKSRSDGCLVALSQSKGKVCDRKLFFLSGLCMASNLSESATYKPCRGSS